MFMLSNWVVNSGCFVFVLVGEIDVQGYAMLYRNLVGRVTSALISCEVVGSTVKIVACCDSRQPAVHFGPF